MACDGIDLFDGRCGQSASPGLEHPVQVLVAGDDAALRHSVERDRAAAGESEHRHDRNGDPSLSGQRVGRQLRVLPCLRDVPGAHAVDLYDITGEADPATAMIFDRHREH